MWGLDDVVINADDLGQLHDPDVSVRKRAGASVVLRTPFGLQVATHLLDMSLMDHRVGALRGYRGDSFIPSRKQTSLFSRLEPAHA